jgi:hypothetical protein
MPTRGALASSSEDDSQGLDPAAVAVAEALLSRRHLPERKEWTPALLSIDLGCDERTWQRRCERGELWAIREGRGYVVLREWIVRYYALSWTGAALN